MNIIDAICNILKLKDFGIKTHLNFHNRTNSLGQSLEEFIKDLFCDTLNENDENLRLFKQSKIFSYIGNTSNPPDLMLKNGDAIEIKKLENFNSAIALNSSYPKAKLYSNSSMITAYCKNSENWAVKDMIYAVGTVQNKRLKSLFFVYGEDYAASDEIYQKVKNAIKNGVLNIPNLDFSETKELGRVNKIDPLGITYLRIRGMWHIQNPLKVFEYIYKIDKDMAFSFACIINDDKFNSFTNRQMLIDLINKTKGSKILDVLIKNPNNPANLKNAKLIIYEVKK